MTQHNQWENARNESKKDSAKNKSESLNEQSSKSSSWCSVKPAEDDRERRDGPGGN